MDHLEIIVMVHRRDDGCLDYSVVKMKMGEVKRCSNAKSAEPSDGFNMETERR